MSKYYAHINSKRVLVGVGIVKMLSDEYGSNDVLNIETTQEVFNDWQKYIYQDGEIILDPEYEAKQEEARREQFNKDFFNTSLGYVRRKVSMATGETKDFLSDLLPTISMGVQMGQPVTIITYNEPDFTQEIIDWTILQRFETVTTQFVQECFTQLSNDFKPVNNSETDVNNSETVEDENTITDEGST